MIPSNPLLSISTEGWCEGVARAPCDNFEPRPEGADISLLVIHNISLPPGQFGSTHIEALFANTLDCDAHPYFAQLRGLKVSAHFLIRRDGTALQFVPTTQRAWHAGVSAFKGRERCNDFSIGIELEGSDDQHFTDAQYRTLAGLTLALTARHPITDLAGHSDIAPGRKTDPGPFFSWQQYRAQCKVLAAKTISYTKDIAALSFPD